MIAKFIKKQGLLFLRNPQELLLLLGMPLVLITILGFALGEVMTGDAPGIDARVAIVEHGSEDADMKQFTANLEKIGMSSEQKKAILQSVQEIQPVRILKEDIFGSKEMEKHMKLVSIPPSKLADAKKDDKYAAIIEVPENFTLQMLEKMVLGKEAAPKLNLYKNEGKTLSPQIVEEVLADYQKQFSTMAVLGKNGLLTESVLSGMHSVNGAVETVTKKDPINAVMYYTVGMSVMFVLFIAAYIGSYAFKEKELHVFDRIILANVPGWTFFTGIFVSGMIFAFIQLMILYGVTGLVYQVKWPDIPAFLVVCAGMSFAVGGLAVLLTAISYRFNSQAVITFFESGAVAILAFLGGSFFPAGEMSPLINSLGNLTPNGAGMTAYLKLLQGYGLEDISGSLAYLGIFGAVLLLAAAISFPKRGKAL